MKSNNLKLKNNYEQEDIRDDISLVSGATTKNDIDLDLQAFNNE